MAAGGHGEVRDYDVRESNKVPGEGVSTLVVFCKSERVHLITARVKHSLDLADKHSSEIKWRSWRRQFIHRYSN